jgi:hypothetical protein
VLAAVDLGRLAEDGGAAVAHQAIHRGAQCRVGTDAAVAVAAATLQAHREVAGRHRLAFHAVGLGEHLPDHRHAARHRLGRAAGVLDVEGAKPCAFAQALLRDQALDLVRLAAQADDQHAGEVGMPRVTAQRAPQHLQFLAVAGRGAAHAVGEGDHTVDVREGCQGFGVDVAAEVVGDRPRGGGRAVHAGQHADVVARGHTPVGAHDAFEGGRRVGMNRRHDAGARLVRALEVGEGQVVGVHMLAGRDGLRGGADDLAIAPHRLTGGDGAAGHLVAGRHQARDHHGAFSGERGTAEQLPPRDDDVVGRVDADDRRVGAVRACRAHGLRRRSAPGPRHAPSAAARRASRCPAA